MKLAEAVGVNTYGQTLSHLPVSLHEKPQSARFRLPPQKRLQEVHNQARFLPPHKQADIPLLLRLAPMSARVSR